MPFNHNFDGHLGESLRQRPGFCMSLALAFGVLLSAPASGATARPSAAALPDSVVARMPRKDLTAREYLQSWYTLDPRYRPTGTGMALKRAFLDQLIEKEAIALAANAEPFVMTPVESAQFTAMRADAVRRALYVRLVTDSTVVIEADRDTARAHMAATADGKPIPAEEIERGARTRAEERRATQVSEQIKASLAPVWDDSVTARLARGYAALDPKLPDLSNPMSAHMPNRRPEVAEADTALVLARSSVRPLTVGEFIQRFLTLNPFSTPLPTTAGAVQARGEQFLGQIWFDRESQRQDLLADPRLAAQLASRRESIALDHYYARHVLAKIDTSEAAIRADYAKHAESYAIPAHSRVLILPAADSASADTMLKQLAAGMAWDSLCVRHAPAGTDPANCAQPQSLPDDFTDSSLVAGVKVLAPGQAAALRFLTGNFSATAWMVVRMVERVPHRVRTYEEARTFAVRSVTAEQSETLLKQELARLSAGLKVTRNDAALARLDLGTGTRPAPAKP